MGNVFIYFYLFVDNYNNKGIIVNKFKDTKIELCKNLNFCGNVNLITPRFVDSFYLLFTLIIFIRTNKLT